MKIRLALLAALLALSACKRAAPTAADSFPVKETAAGVPMIDFDSPEAGFSCRAPRDWGVRPEKYLAASKGAAFTGPGGNITILKYPESEPGRTDAKSYAETFWLVDPKGKQPEITEETVAGAKILRFHLERAAMIPHSKTMLPPERYDYALVPVKGGFFEIQHRAPAGEYQKTLPVFEAVVRSFKPKS